MPVYYFLAVDSTQIEGKCELPDDATAIQFAEEIARQITENNSGGATVSVINAQDEKVCDVVVHPPTLH